jgi:hypothetical protein
LGILKTKVQVILEPILSSIVTYNMTAVMNKFVYGIFVFLLVFSPLAFGSVETWSLSIDYTHIDYTPFGPYVMVNHFSAFIIMIVPLTIALFFFYSSQDVYPSFGQKIKSFISGEGEQAKSLFCLRWIAGSDPGKFLFLQKVLHKIWAKEV